MKKVKLLMLALMLAMCSVASAQTTNDLVESFTRMLENYCIEFYSEDFSRRYYEERSLSITSLKEDRLTPNFFLLKGTHSYKGQQIDVHSNVQWEATIELLGNRKYRIKFDKYYEPDIIMGIKVRDGFWERGRTRDYEYPKRR